MLCISAALRRRLQHPLIGRFGRRRPRRGIQITRSVPRRGGQARVLVEYRVRIEEPKSRNGKRTLPLDGELVAALTALRMRQLEESTIAGAAYRSGLARLDWYQGGEYLITNEVGTPVHPEWYSDEFGRLLRRAGLRRITLHDSRHTAHPRSPPPPARPRPPTAPGACPAISECRSGSPPETTSTVPRPEHSSAPPSGEDARVRAVPDGLPPPGPHARICSAHSTSRSSPSLPITGVLTAACPTIHALWQTD